jgi:hypothetical protein
VSDFSLDWLRLRERADLAARAPSLARSFATALSTARPSRIIDLGSGSGANARALLPRIAGDQQWSLVDANRGLLAAQAEEFTHWARRQGYPITAGGGRIAIDARPARWQLNTIPLDLAHDLASLDEIAADGVTAAAFFDLVSRDWLERFVGMLAARRVPLLAVLTVDGRRVWQPALDDDAIVASAFARHQHRDKGFGAALGGAAPATLEDLFAKAGFTIERAASDWRLGPSDDALLGTLLAGEAVAAREAAPGDADRIAAWEKQRRAQLDAHELSLLVGHCDLLALPA